VTEEARRDLARALLRRSAPEELQFRRARWLWSGTMFKERPFDFSACGGLRVTILVRWSILQS